MKTWVKLYTEIIDDPDQGGMTWAQRGIWSALLALAGKLDHRNGSGEETGQLDTVERVAWHLRCDVETIADALAIFADLGMVEDRDGMLYLPNYAKRQGRAPSSRPEAVTQRVTRFRDQHAAECNEARAPCNEDVTRVKRGCNEGETPSDSDTDTDVTTPPSGGGATNQARAEVERAFCRATGLAPPGDILTEKEKRAAGQRWWTPLRKILALAENDVGRAGRLIEDTVQQMRREGLTIAAPASILNVATALQAEKAHRGRDSPAGWSSALTGERVRLGRGDGASHG